MTMLNPLLLSLLLRFSVVALFGLQSSTIEARSLRPPGSGGAGGDSNVAQTEPLLSYPRPWEFTLKQDIKDGNCTLFSIRQVQQYRDLALSIPSPPIFQPKGDLHIIRYDPDPTLGIEIVKVVGYDRGKVEDKAKALCGRTELWDLYETHQQQEQVTLRLRGVDNAGVEPPPLEIEALIESGPSNNRVDLVFFSDGYLKEEKQKFIDDATRLAQDISNNQTFFPVRPLLNFWAAFTPSNESGVGVGGKPKDTPFGLYRDGTELRGVYYAKPDVARAACQSMGDQCDYPIIMGNDPLYGGLGGEFTVITPSLANGALVLRHELGHSVIDVGEEYDGGFAYFGVNAQHDLSLPISWSHWLSKPKPPPKHPFGSSGPYEQSNPLGSIESLNSLTPRVERTVMPLQQYAWTLLHLGQPFKTSFVSSGQYPRWMLRFSLSGVPRKEDFAIRVDGVTVNGKWEFRDGIGLDRWHYDIMFFEAEEGNGGLSEGEHELEFELLSPWWDGVAQLCSVEVLEYGSEDEFITTPGHYSLFPTFSLDNGTTYRPTNADCLMRIVTTPNLCSVCLEGLWLSLLRRVDLMDGVDVGCRWSDTWPERMLRTLDLRLVGFGKFRESLNLDTRNAKPIPGEGYSITWYKDDVELYDFTDSTHVEVDDEVEEGGVGVYTIEVKLFTREVRKDPMGLMRSKGDFYVGERCRGR